MQEIKNGIDRTHLKDFRTTPVELRNSLLFKTLFVLFSNDIQ